MMVPLTRYGLTLQDYETLQDVSPKEGFHIHVYNRNGKEIAVVSGKGKWRPTYIKNT